MPQSPGVSHPCSIAQADETAPASMAVSVICTSTGSSRTLVPGWGRGLRALGQHRAPPDSGWATGWSQAASPAREAPVSRVTATQQGIVASPAPATRAGREQCVTSKSTTPVMATSVSMVPAFQSTPTRTLVAVSLVLLVYSVMSRTRMLPTPVVCLAVNMANVECRAWARHTASVTVDIQEMHVTERWPAEGNGSEMSTRDSKATRRAKPRRRSPA